MISKELRKLITTVTRFLNRLWNKDLKTVRCFYRCEETLNLRAKSLSHSVWGSVGAGRSPWEILQTLTFSTLGYCLSSAWKKLISKAVIVKTNDVRKLLLMLNKQWYLLYDAVAQCGVGGGTSFQEEWGKTCFPFLSSNMLMNQVYLKAT